jgi:hypothetical protein
MYVFEKAGAEHAKLIAVAAITFFIALITIFALTQKMLYLLIEKIS